MLLRRYHNHTSVAENKPSATEEIKTTEEIKDGTITKEIIQSLKMLELKAKAKELEIETSAKNTADELKEMIIEKLGL